MHAYTPLPSSFKQYKRKVPTVALCSCWQVI